MTTFYSLIETSLKFYFRKAVVVDITTIVPIAGSGASVVFTTGVASVVTVVITGVAAVTGAAAFADGKYFILVSGYSSFRN